MAKKQMAQATGPEDPLASTMSPLVAATLTGVIYHARLLNRQSKLNIPESEVISDVVNLWRTVLDVVMPQSQ